MAAQPDTREVSSPTVSDEELARRYFARLALPEADRMTAHKAALARAHELRKFEIENYWKRSAYFWGFQLVAFGALALTAKDGRFHPPFVMVVAVLGALAALTGVLTAKGSKFWQENWEAHVDFLEKPIEGNLHVTALLDKRVSYSVSRVNERFLEVLLAGWAVAFGAAASTLIFPALLKLDPYSASAIQIGGTLLAFLVGAWWLMAGQKSGLRGRAFYRKTMEEWTG